MIAPCPVFLLLLQGASPPVRALKPGGRRVTRYHQVQASTGALAIFMGMLFTFGFTGACCGVVGDAPRMYMGEADPRCVLTTALDARRSQAPRACLRCWALVPVRFC